ncbi:hypothetical protein B0I35DRAFT_429460 [Stachybotrys elegans]|uniref:Uncharacterized protein n=1 Tax=Stachybotrys elegans TaxID=80388 RepID=A0A8K0SMY2_9HYPO|nr:hypothetical protein B0I35DRAFT_429460 [Stachybotrys elegans]
MGCRVVCLVSALLVFSAAASPLEDAALEEAADELKGKPNAVDTIVNDYSTLGGSGEEDADECASCCSCNWYWVDIDYEDDGRSLYPWLGADQGGNSTASADCDEETAAEEGDLVDKLGLYNGKQEGGKNKPAGYSKEIEAGEAFAEQEYAPGGAEYKKGGEKKKFGHKGPVDGISFEDFDLEDLEFDELACDSGCDGLYYDDLGFDELGFDELDFDELEVSEKSKYTDKKKNNPKHKEDSSKINSDEKLVPSTATEILSYAETSQVATAASQRKNIPGANYVPPAYSRKTESPKKPATPSIAKKPVVPSVANAPVAANAANVVTYPYPERILAAPSSAPAAGNLEEVASGIIIDMVMAPATPSSDETAAVTQLVSSTVVFTDSGSDVVTTVVAGNVLAWVSVEDSSTEIVTVSPEDSATGTTTETSSTTTTSSSQTTTSAPPCANDIGFFWLQAFAGDAPTDGMYARLEEGMNNGYVTIFDVEDVSNAWIFMLNSDCTLSTYDRALTAIVSDGGASFHTQYFYASIEDAQIANFLNWQADVCSISGPRIDCSAFGATQFQFPNMAPFLQLGEPGRIGAYRSSIFWVPLELNF